ncbi:MAG: two pore domain potassium channel family protein [Burkholderiales bacterium]|nr:two pore domain potassium channel family protein [Burkholderiales bacterium]
MIPAIVLSILLCGSSTLLHYECLKLLNDTLPRATAIENRAKVLAALGGAMLSHLSQILLFAGAYYLLRDKFGLGGFGGQFKDAFSSFLYFSSETYTTLGLGDIYPAGSLRMLTGIEALTGLLMLSWTASFTYLEMRRYWK